MLRLRGNKGWLETQLCTLSAERALSAGTGSRKRKMDDQSKQDADPAEL